MVKMETIVFNTSEEDLKKAAKIVSEGGLVAFPTETVYGLGADAFDFMASKKAYAAKGRPSDNPLIVHIAKLSDVKRLARDYDEALVKKLADAFWPGPFTLILPKKDEVPKETTGGLDSVAIRMPRNKATLRFIELSNTLISGPSANLSGHPSPTSAGHVKDDLLGKIDGIIDGGACEIGIESTVFDLQSFKILRPGYITPEMIEIVTGRKVLYDEALFSKPIDDPNYHPMAPGQKYKHYAAKAETHIVPQEKLNKRIEEEQAKGKKLGVIQKPDAKSFFAKLRQFDKEEVDLILIGKLEVDDSLNFSIMNRVLKSAGYNIEE